MRYGRTRQIGWVLMMTICCHASFALEGREEKTTLDAQLDLYRKFHQILKVVGRDRAEKTLQRRSRRYIEAGHPEQAFSLTAMRAAVQSHCEALYEKAEGAARRDLARQFQSNFGILISELARPSTAEERQRTISLFHNYCTLLERVEYVADELEALEAKLADCKFGKGVTAALIQIYLSSNSKRTASVKAKLLHIFRYDSSKEATQFLKDRLINGQEFEQGVVIPLLSKSRGELARDALVKGFRHLKSESMRTLCLSQLFYWATDAKVLELASQVAKNAVQTDVLREAVVILGASASRKAKAPLLKVVKRKEVSVSIREKAISILGRLLTDRELFKFSKGIFRDKNESKEIKIAAVRSLRAMPMSLQPEVREFLSVIGRGASSDLTKAIAQVIKRLDQTVALQDPKARQARFEKRRVERLQNARNEIARLEAKATLSQKEQRILHILRKIVEVQQETK